MEARLMLGNPIGHPLSQLWPCPCCEHARHIVELSVVPHAERDGPPVVGPEREPYLVPVVVGLDSAAALTTRGAAGLATDVLQIGTVFSCHPVTVALSS